MASPIGNQAANRKRKIAMKILLSLLIALVLTSTALAHPPRGHLGPGHGHSRHHNPQLDLARWYAREATRQAQAQRRLGCGYSGPRWTTRRQDHFDWALRNAPSRVHQEVDVRNRDLARCQARLMHRHHSFRPW